MIPAGKIYALTQTEAIELDRQHGAWSLWHAIGRRLGVNFNPDGGAIPSVERTGWLSIAVTWMPRPCRSRVFDLDDYSITLATRKRFSEKRT